MRTPKELAQDCIDAFDANPIGPPTMDEIVERAIAAAVEEERESCALAAEELAEAGIVSARDAAAIADAIRARSGGSAP